MLKDIFGRNPQTNILDFLLDHPGYDYSISEIAKHSHVSRPTVYKTIDVLLEKQLVLITRTQGNSQLFKANGDNPLVQKMLAFESEPTTTMKKTPQASPDQQS
jgi:Fe2+ or Zn2+ uptake regulation protein